MCTICVCVFFFNLSAFVRQQHLLRLIQHSGLQQIKHQANRLKPKAGHAVPKTTPPSQTRPPPTFVRQSSDSLHSFILPPRLGSGQHRGAGDLSMHRPQMHSNCCQVTDALQNAKNLYNLMRTTQCFIPSHYIMPVSSLKYCIIKLDYVAVPNHHQFTILFMTVWFCNKKKQLA